MVGQTGFTQSNAGGGGGGSFVWDNAATTLPLIAAGGGGGAGYPFGSAGNGIDAVTTQNGTPGAGGYNGGGISGTGGTVPTSTAGYTSWASGGCGWLSSGNTGTNTFGCVSSGGVYPLSSSTPGAGGVMVGSSSVGNGGYGGGGAGNARCGIIGGGGGGGYSGGGPGCDNNSQYQPGGGGGSYNGGTGQINSVLTTTGNGQVVITVLCTAPGTISGSTAACLGGTVTLTESTPGGTWSSSNTGVAAIGTNGVVSGVSLGTATITYTVSNPCGALATATVTVNPVASPITGSLNACIGQSTSLSSTPAGGAWSSSNTSVATVNSSGAVFGVANGTANISYSLPSGCAGASGQVTVNATPPAPTGSHTVCGSLTTTLTDGVSGGTWSSSNAAVASVGSVSGVVTGGAAGTANITYTSFHLGALTPSRDEC